MGCSDGVDGVGGPRKPIDECAIATTKAGRMTLASRRLCLITAVLYTTWLIAPLLDPQLHPWTSYASEYFVSGRPAATLLRTTDGLSGALLVVISVLSYARLRIVWRGLRLDDDAAPAVGRVSTRRRERVAMRTWCAALAVAGLPTVVDAINPMACAPSLDSACAAADSAGTLPMQHELHTASSALAGIAFIIAMLASIVLSTPADTAVRVSAWAGVVTIAVSGVDALDHLLPTEGITQRLPMIAIVVWLVSAAGLPAVDRLRRVERPHPKAAEAA